MEPVSKHFSGFEAVFRNSMDGLAICRKGVFIDCNQAMLDLLELPSRDDLIGFTPFDFSPEYQFDGQKSSDTGMARVRECVAKDSDRFEWLFRKHGGDIFWAEITLTLVELDGEHFAYANCRDISEKKTLELELCKQKESFEKLFNDSVDGLCLLENDIYIECNQAFLTLHGFKDKSQVIGFTPAQLSLDVQADGTRLSESTMSRLMNLKDNERVGIEWQQKRQNGTVQQMDSHSPSTCTV